MLMVAQDWNIVTVKIVVLHGDVPVCKMKVKLHHITEQGLTVVQ